MIFFQGISFDKKKVHLDRQISIWKIEFLNIKRFSLSKTPSDVDVTQHDGKNLYLDTHTQY